MAAKLKRKIGPIETRCNEVAVGVWRFTTGVYSWEYWEGRPGLTLGCKPTADDGEYERVLWTKTLDHAVMYAHGYEQGRRAAEVATGPAT